MAEKENKKQITAEPEFVETTDEAPAEEPVAEAEPEVEESPAEPEAVAEEASAEPEAAEAEPEAPVEEPAPDPGVTGTWYSLEHKFVIEPGISSLPEPPITGKATGAVPVPQILERTP